MIHFLFILWTIVFSTSVQAESIYKQRKQVYEREQLKLNWKSAFQKIENEAYEKKRQFLEEKLLEKYFTSLETSKEKSAESRVSAFKIKKLSETELKQYYETNKEEIPYPYFLVKDQLQQMYAEEEKQKIRGQLLRKASKKLKFQILLKRPEFKPVKLELEGYAKKFHGKKPRATLVKFGDYKCPYCRSANRHLKSLLSKIGHKVEFVYIDFPVGSSDIAIETAELAYCVRTMKTNELYWKFHDKAFENQKTIYSKNSLIRYAKDWGVWDTNVESCLDSTEAKNFVIQSKEYGKKVGIEKTPTYFLNGKIWNLPSEQRIALKSIKKAI